MNVSSSAAMRTVCIHRGALLSKPRLSSQLPLPSSPFSRCFSSLTPPNNSEAPNLYDTLKSRGLLSATTSTEQFAKSFLSTPNRSAYAGFDPTASSLHVGNLLIIISLMHLRNHGFKVYGLVGGATGRIGDPSGRSTERPMMSEEQIDANARSIGHQISSILERGSAPAAGVTSLHPTEIVNNLDWYGGMSAIAFLRDVGRHFRVGSMLSLDSVRNRMTSSHESSPSDGLSFTEFSYSLLQGYDFYHLYKSKGVTLQVGGSDQWGNITSGTQLIRRLAATHSASSPSSGTSHEGHHSAMGITVPLLLSSTGAKLGKSEGNAVWLDPSMTSPYEMFQYFLRVEDADATRLLRMLTLTNLEKCIEIEQEHAKSPERRVAQRALAEAVVTLVHGKEGLERADTATKALFGDQPLTSLTPAELRGVLAGAPSTTLPRNQVLGMDAAALAVAAGAAASRSAARRLIGQGGLSLNNQRVEDAETRKVVLDDFLNGDTLVLRSGKKSFFVVKVKDE